ncbi:hypothetical protein [Methanobrevibacter sp.]|uniref:hypothetical protein n=1 Tax=Methanobrevibacter sp. TaxID=66852 RepID=UPI00388F45E8
MSELKQLIEKFIEIDDSINEEVEALLEENEDFDEDAFSKEHEDELNELGEIYHEIEHMVFNEEFIIVLNASSEDKEVVALIISDEDEESEEFVIPAYTDEKEAEEAIEVFKEQFDENEFVCETKTGSEIIADHNEDEDFIGIAINAPQMEFVINGEDVHDCCE